MGLYCARPSGNARDAGVCGTVEAVDSCDVASNTCVEGSVIYTTYDLPGQICGTMEGGPAAVVPGSRTSTTCSTDGKPPWSFSVHKAKVEQEGLGYFTSSAMRIRGVPIFYMPYMVWPVKQERAPGLLMPRLGYSDRRGFNIGLPLYVPLGRSYDTTVFADYYTEGYFGLGNGWRWAPVAGAAGEIDLD